MTTTFRRKLCINRGNIGKGPVELVLSFQVPDQDKKYHTQFPVVWKSVKFTGEGNENMEAIYINQLSVLNPQTENGSRVKPNRWVEIAAGQKTALVNKEAGTTFTPPVATTGRNITAENITGKLVDFAFGYINEKQKPIPLIMFPDIGTGSSVSKEFIPILQASVIPGYAEGVILNVGPGCTGDGNGRSDPFWSEDLRALRDVSDWIFERDPITGGYTFQRDLSRF